MSPSESLFASGFRPAPCVPPFYRCHLSLFCAADAFFYLARYFLLIRRSARRTHFSVLPSTPFPAIYPDNAVFLGLHNQKSCHPSPRLIAPPALMAYRAPLGANPPANSRHLPKGPTTVLRCKGKFSPPLPSTSALPYVCAPGVASIMYLSTDCTYYPITISYGTAFHLLHLREPCNRSPFQPRLSFFPLPPTFLLITSQDSETGCYSTFPHESLPPASAFPFWPLVDDLRRCNVPPPATRLSSEVLFEVLGAFTFPAAKFFPSHYYFSHTQLDPLIFSFNISLTLKGARVSGPSAHGFWLSPLLLSELKWELFTAKSSVFWTVHASCSQAAMLAFCRLLPPRLTAAENFIAARVVFLLAVCGSTVSPAVSLLRMFFVIPSFGPHQK